MYVNFNIYIYKLSKRGTPRNFVRISLILFIFEDLFLFSRAFDKLHSYHFQMEIFIGYSVMIVINKIKILKATLLCDYKCFSGFNRQLTT